jgi:sigma-54 dependent transcriptional regulator
MAGPRSIGDGARDARHPGMFQTIEELLVRRAYARCRDNQVRTARLLGISRNTLRTLLKRHGLLAHGAEADGVAVDCDLPTVLCD